MGLNVLWAALNKYGFNNYTYGTGPGQVECNQLVSSALINSGYNIPYFLTTDLFNGTTITPWAKQYFDPITAAAAQASNGTLQVGDIILFQRTSDGKEHMGVFVGYDSSGYPVFYGSQSSTGPAMVDTDPALHGNYWLGGTEKIVGALHPKDSVHTGIDTTTGGVQSSSTGKSIPGQTIKGVSIAIKFTKPCHVAHALN